MAEAANAHVKEALGEERLNELAAIQADRKTTDRFAKKGIHTSVYLFKSPLNHFIYRFCVYFAPASSKDWAKGHRFIEWVLAKGKLTAGERWALEGLMAIRGSRNGVFLANAVAIALWGERALEFLQASTLLLLAPRLALLLP